jgi:hypothetical protein
MLIGVSPHGSSSINANLEPDCQETDNHDGVPDPAALIMCECSRKSGGEHDQICGNGDEEVCAIESAEEGDVDQDERSGYNPVEVSDPEDLAQVFLVRVWDVFVGMVDDGVFVGYAFAGGHGEVREEGDCCDEGCEGVQEAGLLDFTVNLF